MERKLEIKKKKEEENTKPVPVAAAQPEPVKQEMNEGVRLLLENGISENVAVRLGEQYEVFYLREKIALANAHPEYIKNKAGFLIQAIKENWIDDDIVREQQKEVRLTAQKAIQETQKWVKGIWDRYRMQKGSLGLREYEKLTEEERERTKGAFLQSVNDIVRNIYRKKEGFGYEDGMFRSFFLNTLELPSFENFLVAEGITLSCEEREILEKEVRG